MKIILLAAILLCGNQLLIAQSGEFAGPSTTEEDRILSAPAENPSVYYRIEDLLREIEQNNMSLKTYVQQAEADKLANRTGISLPDPEVELGRLWGNPADIGNRIDIAASQEFDIATLSGARLRHAKGMNSLVELQLASRRTDILLEAKQNCIDLMYYNGLAKVLELRLEHAKEIAARYADKLANGDIGRIEYNKLQLARATAEGELARVEVERAALLASLRRLNGGRQIFFDATSFPTVDLPADFDGWYSQVAGRTPQLAYARREAEVAGRRVSVARMEGLPKFSLGYVRENTLGQYYQGISVGMSIPLWGNRNNVKQARAAASASEARERETGVQHYEQLHTLYMKAIGLGGVAAEYRDVMSGIDSAILLKKALDAGEISLLEYSVEINLYYDFIDLALSSERDYQSACAQLFAMEL